MPDNTTTQTAAERLRASAVDARMFGEGLQHNQYNGHYGSGVQIVRQAEQIRVLVEALEWFSDDNRSMFGDKARAALDAAWALEGDDA